MEGDVLPVTVYNSFWTTKSRIHNRVERPSQKGGGRESADGKVRPDQTCLGRGLVVKADLLIDKAMDLGNHLSLSLVRGFEDDGPWWFVSPTRNEWTEDENSRSSKGGKKQQIYAPYSLNPRVATPDHGVECARRQPTLTHYKNSVEGKSAESRGLWGKKMYL